MIVIVGGGVAGLTCARVLHQAGAPFQLLERQPTFGGRVQTDVTSDGFRLDRGFQVLFTRYPAVRRHLDLERLGVRQFTPGAVIAAADGSISDLDDPLRMPAKAWRALRAPVLSLADKGRVGLEVADLRLRSAEGIWTDRDTTTVAYLKERGFSEQAIEQFFRPLFGGILLDRALNSSSNAFRFTFKMMAEGDIVVPALGMGEIPLQLAASLPPASLRVNAGVEALVRSAGRVVGVQAAGESIAASAVVVAAETATAAELTGIGLPAGGLGMTTVYFAGSAPLLTGKKLWLNAAPDGYINSAVQLSAVAAEYAPPNQHLLSVAILGDDAGDDAQVEARTREELVRWNGAVAVDQQQLVGIRRIPFAQFPQPVGFSAGLPPVRTELPGLYLGGEVTRSSSINGAMEAGEAAARAVIEDFPHLVAAATRRRD